ncbi:MAG TPA: hypothetical protein VMT30_03750 [Candidatus Saccharimonadia bacterium]|nr:hypothetical protein [Candidatus Saccharimonadia bacterium]
MLDPRFVILASIIDLFGTAAYALDTLRGRTQPNRVSWLLWTVIPFITFAAQLSEHVGWSALFTLVVAVGPGAVLIASFLDRKAYWKITQFDIVCGLLSVLAIILWLITQTGLIAILLSLAADFLAGIPTLVKSYREPHTESSSAYFAGIFSSGLTLLTIHTWNFATYSFPVYILIFCLVLFTLVQFPRFRPSHQPKVSS